LQDRVSSTYIFRINMAYFTPLSVSYFHLLKTVKIQTVKQPHYHRIIKQFSSLFIQSIDVKIWIL